MGPTCQYVWRGDLNMEGMGFAVIIKLSIFLEVFKTFKFN
jgi:hypothetical protein